MTGKRKINKPGRKNKTVNINFICSGNTCRSYIAEAIASHLLKTIYNKRKPDLKDRVNIGSAGTDISITAIPVNTFRALDIFEIPNIKFKPTPIDELIVEKSDLLITMATSHKLNVISKFKRIDRRKILNLLELSNIILYIETEDIYKRVITSKLSSSSNDFIQKIQIIKEIGSESIIKPEIIDIEDPFGSSIDKYVEVSKLLKENIIIIFDYLFR